MNAALPTVTIKGPHGQVPAPMLFRIGELAVTKESLGLGPDGAPAFGERLVITHVPTGRTVMARIGTFESLQFATLAVERLTPLANWEFLKEPTPKLRSQVESVLLAAVNEERAAKAGLGKCDG